jgi:hypothetical protein
MYSSNLFIVSLSSFLLICEYIYLQSLACCHAKVVLVYISDDKQKIRMPNQNKKEKKMKWEDVEELMGVHKDVYTRKNGAVRRK